MGGHSIGWSPMLYKMQISDLQLINSNPLVVSNCPIQGHNGSLRSPRNSTTCPILKSSRKLPEKAIEDPDPYRLPCSCTSISHPFVISSTIQNPLQHCPSMMLKLCENRGFFHWSCKKILDEFLARRTNYKIVSTLFFFCHVILL